MSLPFRKLEVFALAGSLCLILLSTGCSANSETFVPRATGSQPSVQATPVSTLFPGGGAAPPDQAEAARYANDPQAISEGARLFDWYNCAGCHFHGAGGIGPSLMDNQWIYGGEMQQIYSTIYQGRPNGMPSWGGKLAPTEIWEISAYVHDLAARNAAATGEPVDPLPAVRDADAREPQIPTSSGDSGNSH